MEKGIRFFFDEEADVLYFSKGEPSTQAESQEIGEDMVARLDPQTKEVVGLTIFNFVRRFQKEKSARSIPIEARFLLLEDS